MRKILLLLLALTSCTHKAAGPLAFVTNERLSNSEMMRPNYNSYDVVQ